MDREVLEHAMKEAGVPLVVVANVLRDLLVTAQVHLAGVTSDPVDYLRGGKQGGRITPRLWRQYLDRALKTLDREEELGRGLLVDHPRGGFCINHFVWADDVWILASSPSQLRALLTKATRGLEAAGLHWKIEEKAAYAANAFVRNAPDKLEFAGYSLEKGSCIPCLGWSIDVDGDAEATLDHRLGVMQKHFWARSAQLRYKKVQLNSRILRYGKTVRRTFLHGAGCLTLTQKLASKITSGDQQCVRRAWRPAKRANETTVKWLQRANSGAKALTLRAGLRTLLEETLEAHHGWSGHVARMDPDNVCRKLSEWKAESWWKPYRQEMLKHDPRNTTNWCHHRTGDIRTRWDHQLCLHHGTDWHEEAQGRERWITHRRAFVAEAYKRLTKTPENAIDNGT